MKLFLFVFPLFLYLLIKSAKHPMTTAAIATPISRYITVNDGKIFARSPSTVLGKSLLLKLIVRLIAVAGFVVLMLSAVTAACAVVDVVGIGVADDSLNTKDENKITQRKLVQMQAGRCNSTKNF